MPKKIDYYFFEIIYIYRNNYKKMEQLNYLKLNDDLNKIKLDIEIIKNKLSSKKFNDNLDFKKIEEIKLLNEHSILLEETIDLIKYKKKGYIALIKIKERDKNIKELTLNYQNKYNEFYKIPYKELSEKINNYTNLKKEHDTLYNDYKKNYPDSLNIDEMYLNKKRKLI